MSETTIAKLQGAVDAALRKRSRPRQSTQSRIENPGNSLLTKKTPVDPAEILKVTRGLELELHNPAVRADRRRLEALLHRDFVEIGRSGTRYSRSQLLEALLSSTESAAIHAQGFAARPLAAGAVLLTYQSAQLCPDGTIQQHALRSSVWSREAAGWQILFHQGTPTAAFELEDCPESTGGG